MRTKLTKRAYRLTPSLTFAIDASVKELQQQGVPVINLGIGEPDFETPKHIKASAIKAIKEGFTRYTQTAGIPDLRKAISEKLRKENHIIYKPSQIIVGSGSKQILYTTFQVLCERDDEVIIPIPAWNSYVEQVILTEATPKLVQLEPPFKITARIIEAKITPKTKIILLNSPSNPTGAVIEKEELEKIAVLAVKHKIWVVTDEIYEKIIYGEQHISIASLSEKIKKLTITVNGFSKTYAMTGWRIGYAAGPQEVITAMSDIQSQLTANASSISQKAAIAAIFGPKRPIVKMIREFTKRREFLFHEFTKIPQLEIVFPEGSFFFFIGIKKLLNEKYPTSNAWCEGLLQKKHVAVIPGEAFFAPGFFRLSFSAPIRVLMETVKRMKEFIYEI